MERSIDLSKFEIHIHEPLAEALKAPANEVDFSLSLLDVARFSGHCCVAVSGAFLVTRAAISHLFPDGRCVRGDLSVEIPSKTTPAATGPVANVISYITGAWAETGFKGLSGEHARKDLMHFGSPVAPAHSFVFTRKSTGKSATVRFDSSDAVAGVDPSAPFAERVNTMVRNILSSPDSYVQVEL